jgi:hypothetical protein
MECESISCTHDNQLNHSTRFRWVFCQLGALKKCHSIRELRESLESLPDTLEETYARILSSIDSKHARTVYQILQWLAFSARPLRLTEVADVVGIDVAATPRFDPERKLFESSDILTICSTLVTTSMLPVEDTMLPVEGRFSTQILTAEYITLSHFSVKEYLVSSSIKKGPASTFSISEIDSNRSIAEGCLAYILQFDVADSMYEANILEYTLTKYTTQFWAEHTRAAKHSFNQAVLNSLVEQLYVESPNAYRHYRRFIPTPLEWRAPLRAQLIDASFNGLLHAVEVLLLHGADVNAQGGRDGNALQAASAGGHVELVQLLLEKGADVKAQGGSDGNALQAASA